MSASPADRTPGRTPGQTPNGNVPPPRPRAREVNPLRQPKRRPVRPQGLASNRPTTNLATRPPPTGQAKDKGVAQQTHKPLPQDLNTSLLSLIDDNAEPEQSGFTTAQPGTYTDYPLVISKRALMEGYRHHVARFYSKKTIDPRDEEDFTRPVRLHRRDPKSLVPGKEDSRDPNDIALEEEREKQDQLRAEREANRVADMAVVAPSANNAKRTVGKQQISQVFQHDETEEQRARSKLRYEEALQWYMEDFDNKQTWVGSYEAALSGTYAQLVFKDGKFHMTPLEKWYKFTPRMHHKPMTLEAAEDQMKSKPKEPDWLKRSKEADTLRKEEEKNQKAVRGLFLGKTGESGDNTVKHATGRARDTGDADELDFEEDFADDEENPVFEGEQDDLKETAQRIKRDQLQANLFNLKDEKSYEEADQQEKRNKKALKLHGKRITKALMKREKNYIYESADSDDNPYSSDSESTDSEAERLKEEEAKKEAERKAKANQSGASSKGNNTPSNRPSKHPDPVQRSVSTQPPKRNGSPNISDASGNESSRKKQKKKLATGSNLGTGVNTPNGPPSRPRSPAPSSDAVNNRAGVAAAAQRKNPSVRPGGASENLKRPRPGAFAGSGSEGDGAGSGGDMSDGGVRKRAKHNLGGPSRNATPGGSRAASPDRGVMPDAASRSASPAASGPPLPTAEELRAAIPEDGILISELLKKFKGGAVTGKKKDQFFKTLKTVSVWEKSTKRILRK